MSSSGIRCPSSIPDVFLPLDDPTYNDFLTADNYGPSEDPHQLLMQDTDLLLAHDRVMSSVAAFRHRVHEQNPLLLQYVEQFGPKLFVTGINLDPNRVSILASVNHFWFHVCTSRLIHVQFLALYRMIQLSTRWNIPASVRSLAGEERYLLYEFSGRLRRQLRLVNLKHPLHGQT